MLCVYCGGNHDKAADVRVCWQRTRDAAELEQIREHGLAAAGLSDAPADKAQRADELRAAQTLARSL